MKRLISIVLVVMLAIMGNAALADFKTFNEDFAIRNGFHFNATEEEVIEIEKANGSSEKEDYLAYSTIVADIDFDLYYYPENGVVNEFQYGNLEIDRTTVDKNALFDIFAAKYGTPTYSSYSATPFETKLNDFYGHWGIAVSGHSYYYGWLIKYNDCYLYVELAADNAYLLKMNWSFVVINYKLMSADEVESVFYATAEKNQQITDSINSSF